jgi:crotonobetainyl-CoA:carnitine CoA-transferase CaiB-like acyl-CoA transferase
VPYETFATADGTIAIGVGSERQWPRFCAALGAPELAADPRFATNGQRVVNRAELIPLLAARLETATSADWLARLDAADVPAGPLLDVLEAFATPQATATNARVPMSHPALGSVDQVRSPFEFTLTPASIRTPPPLLGEHRDEVLVELGYDFDAIERLRADGVV